MLFAIAKFLKTTFYGLCFLIDGIFYSLISTFYQVFIAVSKVSLYNDSSDQIGALTERVYTILGIAMLFVVAYNIILLIINPDKASSGGDKSIQGIFKGFVISVVIITVLPPIFKYMSILQNDIIDSRVIEQMILGSDGLASSEPKTMGNNISTMIYATFYHPITSDGDAVSYEECKNDSSLSSSCSDFVDAYAAGVVENVGSFIKDSKLEDGLTSKTPTMEFLPLVSTIGGVVALLMFISYAFDVGIRVAKLAFLQIIAPIPVMLRITKPSGGVFSKWVSNLIKTYLSLFLRLITIYFSMYMIELLVSGFNSNNGGLFAGIGNVSTIVMLFTKLVLIFGVLLFAKEAPKLLEELIGSSGLGGGFMPKDIAKKLTGAPILGGAAAAAGTLAGKGVGAAAGAAGGAWSALRNNAAMKVGNKLGLKSAKGMTHMSASAAAKQGAAKGYAGGGGLKQFKSQGESIYTNTYGYGKKQGLFGGKSFGTQVNEKYGKAYEANVKQHAKEQNDAIRDKAIGHEIPGENDAASVRMKAGDYMTQNTEFAANSQIYKDAAAEVDREAASKGITLTPEERKAKINEKLSQISATTTNANEKRAIDSYLSRESVISEYNSSVLSGNKEAMDKVDADADMKTKKVVEQEIKDKGLENVITDVTIKTDLKNNARIEVSKQISAVGGDLSKITFSDEAKAQIQENIKAKAEIEIKNKGGINNITLSQTAEAELKNQLSSITQANPNLQSSDISQIEQKLRAEAVTKQVEQSVTQEVVQEHMMNEEYKKQVSSHLYGEKHDEVKHSVMEEAKIAAANKVTEGVMNYEEGRIRGDHTNNADGSLDTVYNAEYAQNEKISNDGVKTKSAEDLAWDKIKKAVLDKDKK